MLWEGEDGWLGRGEEICEGREFLGAKARLGGLEVFLGGSEESSQASKSAHPAAGDCRRDGSLQDRHLTDMRTVD